MSPFVIGAAMLLGFCGSAMAGDAVSNIRAGKVQPYHVMVCTIDKKPEVGICAMFEVDGVHYLAFGTDRLKIIRRLLPEGGYKQVFTFGEVEA